VVSRTQRSLTLVALLAVTALCCLPAIDAPFTFDEQAGLADNRAVHPGAPLRDALLYRFSPDQARPLFFLSLRLDAAVHGLGPRGYRITGLLLHLLTGLAVYALLRRLPIPDGATLAGTAVFLLHPLQSESIIYIWGRSGVLATLLSLLCVLAVPWERGKDATGRAAAGGDDALRWLAAMACLTFALAAKEEPVMLPFLALVWWGLAEARPACGAAWRATVLAVPAALFLAFRAVLLGSVGRQVFVRRLGENLLGQSVVALRMARLVLLPIGQSIDPLARVPSIPLGAMALLACIAVVAVSVIAAFRLLPPGDPARDGIRCACAGVVFAAIGDLLYFVAPLPDLMSERRAYLPMVGVALAVAGAIAAIAAATGSRGASHARGRGRGGRADEPSGSRLPAAACAILVALLAPLLLARARLWSDPRLLWEEARRRAPDKSRPLINLGVMAAQAGDRQAAGALFDRVVLLETDNAEALYNRGRLRLDSGDLTGAAEDLETAIQVDPTLPRIWINLAIARMRLGDPARAEQALRAALRIDPGEPRALTNLAEILRSQGRPDEAIDLYRRALASDPGYAHAAVRLGVALESRGERGAALEAYREYLARGPASPADRDAALAKIRTLEADLAAHPER
jgi:Tfp pilus assembly protein PilF